MAIYDVNGNAISTGGGTSYDEESAIISASGYNTYKSGNAGSPVAYKKNLTFAIITDLHGSGQSLSNFISYINEKSQYLDFAICLGDNVPIYGSTETAWYDNALANSDIPFFAIVGNHDIKSVNLSVALGKLFYTPKAKGWLSADDFGSSSNGYWYKDFSSYKVRVIGLMEFDNADLLKDDGRYAEYKWYDTAQLQWFADTLYSTPSDYSVVVFTHEALRDTGTIIQSPFTRSGSFSGGIDMAVDGEPIGDILNAYITGSNISVTYSPISSLSSKIQKTATVSKDFSGRGAGKFMCHICGHTHSSWIVQDNTYSSIKSVLVPSGSSNIYQRQWDDIRYADTDENMNNFYIVGIETSGKKVNLVKIGSHSTVDMTERYFGNVSV